MENLQIFVSYSSKDVELAEQLVSRLSAKKSTRPFSVFYDQLLKPGSPWDETLREQLENADIVLFLMSPDSLESDFVAHEVELAMRRADDPKFRVIPILLRPCNWQRSPLARFRILPLNNVPIAERTHPGRVIEDVAESIVAVIESLDGFAEGVSNLPHRFSGPVTKIAFARDSDGWVCCGEDGTVILFNGSSLGLRLDTKLRLGDLVISPDGKLIAATVPDEGRFVIFDEKLKELPNPGSEYSELLSVTNSNLVFPIEQRFLLWDPRLSTRSEVPSYLQDPPTVISAVDDSVVVYGTSPGNIRLGGKGDGFSFGTVPGEIRRAAIGRESTRVAVIGDEPWLVRLFEANLRLDHPAAFEIAISADSTIALTASSESIKIWDVNSGTELKFLPANGRTITAAGLAPDGSWAAIGYSDGELLRWNIVSKPATETPLPTGDERLELAYLAVLENPRFFSVLETLDDAVLREALGPSAGASLKERHGTHHPPALWAAWMRNTRKDKLGLQ